jgi:ribosomal protein S18 acetylase RimI-like enzyme
LTEVIRLRRHLAALDAVDTHWPSGFRPAPLSAVEPAALHLLLDSSYRNGFGAVPPFAQWWLAVTADAEFDPDLVFIALADTGALAGMALCWSSAFIKDLAVAEDHRGKGVGAALLRSAFAAFQRHGASHVDLKVMAGNAAALRLYQSLGMTEVPL